MTRPAFTEAQKRQHSEAMKKMWRRRKMAAKPSTTKYAYATTSRRAPFGAKHELVQALGVIRKYLS